MRVLLLFVAPILAVCLHLPCSSPRTERLCLHTRRQFLISSVGSVSLTWPSLAYATGNMPAVQGKVANMDASKKAASDPTAAKKQITAAYIALEELESDFDKVSGSGGGDGVRRVLGTVGTDSPLYLIEKALRLLFEADETLPMEYIDKTESFMNNIATADSEAYSAIFIEFSSAKGKPEDYFKKSKAATIRARADLRSIMDFLGL